MKRTDVMMWELVVADQGLQWQLTLEDGTVEELLPINEHLTINMDAVVDAVGTRVVVQEPVERVITDSEIAESMQMAQAVGGGGGT